MVGVIAKPRLSLLRIAEMNLGFLGLQFSFGLQQANMAPIYSYLGAHESALPLLQLAGPMTGLLVQPYRDGADARRIFCSAQYCARWDCF